MLKSQIHPMPKFFERYIHPVDDIELIDGLTASLDSFDEYTTKLSLVGDKRYAPEKWTTKDVIRHVIDNERIQAYRALRISRNDPTVLPGYDEGLIAQNAATLNVEVEELILEFKLVRQSNILLFKSMTDEMLQRTGICYQVEISALALGFVLIGHQMHHLQVLKERYLDLN